MPVMTFLIATDEDAASMFKQGGSYPPSGPATKNTASGVARKFSGAQYEIRVNLIRFLASFPADSTKLSSALSLTALTLANANSRSLVGEIYSYDGSADSSDYTEGSVANAFTKALSDFAVGVPEDVPLSSTFTAALSNNGYVGLRLAISGTSPTGDNSISFNESLIQLFVAYHQVTAPTNLTPNSGTLSKADIILLEWDHHDGGGLPQSNYEIEYSENGGALWVPLGPFTSPNEFHSLAGGFFTTNGAKLWRVRTASEGNFGAWSAQAQFSVGNAVAAPNITSPTGSVTTALPTIVQTSTETLRTKTQWRVWKDVNGDGLLNTSGLTPDVLIYDTGELTTASLTHLLEAQYFRDGRTSLEDLSDFLAQTRQQVNGVWSAYDTQAFSTAFDPPATPLLTVIAEPDLGFVTLSPENPAGGDAVASNEIWRAQGVASIEPGVDFEPGTFIRIKTGLEADEVWEDRKAPPGVPLFYKVVAIGESGAEAESDTQNTQLDLEGLWIHDESDPENTLIHVDWLSHDDSYSDDFVPAVEFVQYFGNAGISSRAGISAQQPFRTSVIFQNTPREGFATYDQYRALVERGGTKCVRTSEDIYFGIIHGRPRQRKIGYHEVALEMTVFVGYSVAV